jgi:hypothetical protein
MHHRKIELQKLINRGQVIQSPKVGDGITKESCAKWTQDVETYADRHLKSHPAYQPIKKAIFFSKIDNILGRLSSVYDDNEFWTAMSPVPSATHNSGERDFSMYDIFISHASADKISYVEELKASLSKLKVNIFYDKDTLQWGDNWKNKILEGVEKAEFAIIVISENFFGREWTEIELNEFFNRQNQNGQKIILPLLHNISIDQLKVHYPAIADIQALATNDFTCDEIALQFAAQLIKRLKS